MQAKVAAVVDVVDEAAGEEAAASLFCALLWAVEAEMEAEELPEEAE